MGKTKCDTCIYRTTVSVLNNGTSVACAYILHKGKMRGCKADSCDKYIKGKAIKFKSDLFIKR